MPEDIVRVLRLVEYTGPRDWMEKQIAGSIHGTKIIKKQTAAGEVECRITGVTLSEFPECLEKARLQEDAR